MYANSGVKFQSTHDWCKTFLEDRDSSCNKGRVPRYFAATPFTEGVRSQS